jgi:tetratricopeptide (TPR) repeat protein
MSILSFHAGSWHGDKWYRRAWYIWPQAISLLLVGWLFAGALIKPIPWAEPPKDGTTKPRPEPNTDVAICSGGSPHDALAACGRLIDKGLVRYYFNRARIHFRNGAYDWAIEDFSAFIRLNPNSVAALNERGLSYASKGDYDRAIGDYTEAIRLDRKSVLSFSWRGSAYEKKRRTGQGAGGFSGSQPR